MYNPFKKKKEIIKSSQEKKLKNIVMKIENKDENNDKEEQN